MNHRVELVFPEQVREARGVGQVENVQPLFSYVVTVPAREIVDDLNIVTATQ